MVVNMDKFKILTILVTMGLLGPWSAKCQAAERSHLQPDFRTLSFFPRRRSRSVTFPVTKKERNACYLTIHTGYYIAYFDDDTPYIILRPIISGVPF
ncbi:MAG: hypothetical protein RLZ12_719 [Bacillota bacterium]|jgi:hypothetical protein